MTTSCSCGCTEPHKIANRLTADGKTVTVWSDGSLTYALGLYIPKLGKSRDPLRVEAVRLIVDNIGLLDFAELAVTVKRVQSALSAKKADPWAYALQGLS